MNPLSGKTSLQSTCMTCGKKHLSLIDKLNYAELEILESHRIEIHYKKRETIYKEGTKPLGLLCLNAGKAKLVRTAANGKEQIVGLRKPVDFIDVRPLMTDSPHRNTAVALENSSVCIIDKNDFIQVVKNNSDLSMKLIRFFAEELDEADKRLVNMTQKHLRARLADAILQLLDIYGTLPDNETVNCTLKRSDLAGLSNMTTANVIRTISSFNKEGIIENEKKRIKIKKSEALKTISEQG